MLKHARLGLVNIAVVCFALSAPAAAYGDSPFDQGPGPGRTGPGNPPEKNEVPSKEFCNQYSLADFRIHFINFKDEFMMQKTNLLDPLAALDVCRKPSLRHHKITQKMMIGGILPGLENPTFEQYIKAQLKSIESKYRDEFWKNWQMSGRGGMDMLVGARTDRDRAADLRNAQDFYDHLFDNLETFFNQTVPQFCEDVKNFVHKTRQNGDTSIGDFIMEHLLPVQMDTVIKFVRFLRCSWTDKDSGHRRRTETLLDRWTTEYNPKTSTGIEGVDFGDDAVSIQNNILNQLLLVADQLKDLSFKPPAYLPEVEIPEGEWNYQTYLESMSAYMKVRELRFAFNSSEVSKAVRDAKEMIVKMRMGEAVPLENLFLTILAKAQEDEFWQKVDEIVARLCHLQNNWLDGYLYSSLIHLIEEVVVMSGPGGVHRFSADEYFGHNLPILFRSLKRDFLMDAIDSFLYMEGSTCANGECYGPGLSVFRDIAYTLVPPNLDKLFSKPGAEEPCEYCHLQPRYSVRNALGLEFLGPFYDNTKLFVGGLIVHALSATRFADLLPRL